MEEKSVFMPYAAVALSPLVDFYDKMVPWLLLAAALVVVDARFGVAAARARGERIRVSRLWRRSLGKLMDYVCWVTLAGLCMRSFGVVLGVPAVSMGLLFIVYGIEITSCVNNYFEYKGIRKKFNFWKLVNRPEIEDALEDAGKKDEKDEKENDSKGNENLNRQRPRRGDAGQAFPRRDAEGVRVREGDRGQGGA